MQVTGLTKDEVMGQVASILYTGKTQYTTDESYFTDMRGERDLKDHKERVEVDFDVFAEPPRKYQIYTPQPNENLSNETIPKLIELVRLTEQNWKAIHNGKEVTAHPGETHWVIGSRFDSENPGDAS
jgi:hypothetical protein